jgi:hypothetical protein
VNLSEEKICPRSNRYKNYLYFFFAVILASILAMRSYGIAPDDYTNSDNFNRLYQATNPSIVYFLLEEPLWNLYTIFLGSLVNTELAVRITIFISTLVFLISMKRIVIGSWIFLMLAFILDSSLATQMYFNQIRQGLALSLFLFLTAYFNKSLVAAILSSLIHSALILVSIALAILRFSFKNKYVLGIYGSLAALTLAYIYPQLTDIYYGRRTDNYFFEGILNWNYYIVNIPKYVFGYLLINTVALKDEGIKWREMVFIYTLLALIVTMIFSAGGRLMYFSSVFVVIGICHIPTTINRSFIAKSLWISILVLQAILNIQKYGYSSTYTVTGRWISILGM